MRLADSHVHITDTSTLAVRTMLDELADYGVTDVALQSISTKPTYDRVQSLAALLWKSKYTRMSISAFGCLHELDAFAAIPYEKQAEELLALGCDGMKFLHMKPDLRKMIGKGLDHDSYDGVLPFNDKVSPEIIKRETGMSKNEFKRAVGNLLKAGRIEIAGKVIRRK